MFTGIIEQTGRLVAATESQKAIQMTIRAEVPFESLRIGDSVAVNGCCLTVVTVETSGGNQILGFDLLQETWKRTNLQFAQPGALVNLERALLATGRIDGHFVTGHIDGTGRIEIFEKRGTDWFLQVAAPPEIARYTVFKGAMAVDGISLTIAECDDRRFGIWIIPHTYQVTALQERQVGDAVNLEADLLAKYVEKFASGLTQPPDFRSMPPL